MILLAEDLVRGGHDPQQNLGADEALPPLQGVQIPPGSVKFAPGNDRVSRNSEREQCQLRCTALKNDKLQSMES